MIPTHSKIGQEVRVVKSEETYSVRATEQYFEKESQQSGNEYGRAVRL